MERYGQQDTSVGFLHNQLALWSFYSGDYPAAVQAARDAQQVWVRRPCGRRAAQAPARVPCCSSVAALSVSKTGSVRQIEAQLCAAGQGDGSGQRGGGVSWHTPGNGAHRWARPPHGCPQIVLFSLPMPGLDETRLLQHGQPRQPGEDSVLLLQRQQTPPPCPAAAPAADGRPEEAFPLLERGMTVAAENYNQQVAWQGSLLRGVVVLLCDTDGPCKYKSPPFFQRTAVLPMAGPSSLQTPSTAKHVFPWLRTARLMPHAATPRAVQLKKLEEMQPLAEDGGSPQPEGFSAADEAAMAASAEQQGMARPLLPSCRGCRCRRAARPAVNSCKGASHATDVPRRAAVLSSRRRRSSCWSGWGGRSWRPSSIVPSGGRRPAAAQQQPQPALRLASAPLRPGSTPCSRERMQHIPAGQGRRGSLHSLACAVGCTPQLLGRVGSGGRRQVGRQRCWGRFLSGARNERRADG